MPSDSLTVGERQIELAQLAADVVGLLQHIAGGGDHAFGFGAQRVRRGAQRVVEEEIETRGEVLVGS